MALIQASEQGATDKGHCSTQSQVSDNKANQCPNGPRQDATASGTEDLTFVQGLQLVSIYSV